MKYSSLIALLLTLSAMRVHAGLLSPPSVPVTALHNTIALTFDDGPTREFTPQILAILKKYNVKATFFVVGNNAKKYPDIIKAMHEQGHVIANHSMTHLNLTKLSAKELQYEIDEPQQIVFKITGQKPACLRYPFGASNAAVNAAIRADGINPVPVPFNAYDYKQPGVDIIIKRVLDNSHSGQVIVMHDGIDHRQQTVDALTPIIEGIKKKGLGFSTICG